MTGDDSDESRPATGGVKTSFEVARVNGKDARGFRPDIMRMSGRNLHLDEFARWRHKMATWKVKSAYLNSTFYYSTSSAGGNAIKNVCAETTFLLRSRRASLLNLRGQGDGWHLFQQSAGTS